jgi:hypothetical protein
MKLLIIAIKKLTIKNMEQQYSFEHNVPRFYDDVFVNNEKKYRVIGHGIAVAKENKGGGLPLNDIDKKIINYIREGIDDTVNYHHDEHGFSEDSPHTCDDSCLPLDLNIANYIDDVITKIESFSRNYESKWTKDYYLLGFYRPFHFYEDWGIFIKATGQARKTMGLKRIIDADSTNQYGNPSLEACYLISKTFTFFHEFYHHKIESLAVKFELITRQPYYTNGFHCLYCNTFNTERCLEEAFAHSYAYFETCENLYPYLFQMGVTAKQLRYILKKLILKKSPPGYNLAEKIISANNKQEARNFEFYFFEAVLKYSYKMNTGNDLDSIIDENYWKNFKHATHPILFTENEVTYVIDFDDLTEIQVQRFLLP